MIQTGDGAVSNAAMAQRVAGIGGERQAIAPITGAVGNWHHVSNGQNVSGNGDNYHHSH